MPTLTIEGKRVKVDDSFLSLTPEQQSQAVEEIAGSLGIAAMGESAKVQAGREELGKTFQDFAGGANNELGTARAFSENMADMAGFGLADEAAAGIGSIAGMLPGGHGKDYDSIKREIAAQRTQNDENHPVAAGAGMVAGVIGNGVSLARGGLTFTGNLATKSGLPAKIIAGAKDGATYGGLYGFGSGEGFEDRLKQGAGGAAAGGMIGGAVPAVVSGIKAVARPVTDAVSARTNPGGYASKKVAERLSASNMTPGTVAQKMANAPGSSVADVGGKSTRDLLRTVVNIPGPAKDRVAKQVTIRQFGQGDRLKTAIGRTFADPDGYMAAKDDIAQTAKTVADPLYKRAYARPVHYSQTLEEILNTPAGKSALSKAQALADNEQIPFKQVFININGQAKRVPDTRGWDFIKRAMDDMIDGQTDAITRKVTNEGRILTGLKNRMLAEVDSFNPDYKAARAAFGGVAQLDEALEFGRKALNMAPDVVRRQIKNMSPAQKEAARVGAAEDLRKAIDGAGYTNNAVLKIFNSRQRIGNLRALFDNDTQFAEFRKTIFQEARKRSTYDAVRGNSTTASQLADMMEAGGSSEAANFVGRSVTQGPVSATLQWVGSRLKMLGGLTPEVADRIAKQLMNVDPAQTRMLVNELMKIEQAQIAGAQKSALVQQLVTKVLSAPTLGAIQQNR